jgi:hypothetical protein
MVKVPLPRQVLFKNLTFCKFKTELVAKIPDAILAELFFMARLTPKKVEPVEIPITP